MISGPDDEPGLMDPESHTRDRALDLCAIEYLLKAQRAGARASAAPLAFCWPRLRRGRRS